MSTKLLVGLTLLIGALSGCTIGQSEFNCSRGDENALCASSRTVYKATDGDLKENETITYVKDGEPVQITLSELAKERGDYSGISEISNHAANYQNVPHSFSYDGNVLRKDVRVMRVWIAPFTDTNDNLHMSTMVYTDIEDRKWEIGYSQLNAHSDISNVAVHKAEAVSKSKPEEDKPVNKFRPSSSDIKK
jgi:conjugal transfer pilus assembly protein TraV